MRRHEALAASSSATAASTQAFGWSIRGRSVVVRARFGAAAQGIFVGGRRRGG